jgi:hypothetical protein
MTARGKFWSGKKQRRFTLLLKLISEPTFTWAAHRGLVGRNRDRDNPEKGRFARAEVEHILEQGWHNFDREH